MRIIDLQRITEFGPVPILRGIDPRAKAILAPDRFDEIAEAVDTVRVFELLHRHQYQPVAIIRSDDGRGEVVRAYFTRKDRGANIAR